MPVDEEGCYEPGNTDSDVWYDKNLTPGHPLRSGRWLVWYRHPMQEGRTLFGDYDTETEASDMVAVLLKRFNGA